MTAMRRARDLIEQLALAPHPEGGSYRQIYRSSSIVQPADGRGARRSLTTIYFLLEAGQHSRWHRVRSDEAWHLYEGDPLELFVADPAVREVTPILLAPIGMGQPVHVVPAGWWQAARATGPYGLAGCTVGPGFEFDDFAFLRDDAAACEALRAVAPSLAVLL